MSLETPHKTCVNVALVTSIFEDNNITSHALIYSALS